MLKRDWVFYVNITGRCLLYSNVSALRAHFTDFPQTRPSADVISCVKGILQLVRGS